MSQYVGKPKQRKLLGRWRRRCEDNIKSALKQRGFEIEGCINIAKMRV
jgi:hypothetical protein